MDGRMTHKKTRFLAVISAFALVISSLFTPLSTFAVSSINIDQSGPNMAIDTGLSVGTGEWRLETSATALPNTNGTPANASVIFGYVDEQNYYYANFAASAGAGLSGVYRVSGGSRTTLATYANAIAPNQSYGLEVRHKDGAIRVYLGTTFLYKVSSVSVVGTKLGVATVSGNANFMNATHTLGSVTTALNLSLVGGEPAPGPTPPTVQITAPANGATVSGTQNVTAAASDAQGITSVQFKLDGANLGAADTTSPYSISWDTTTASNASHTLAAVATNQASLSTTATIGVTVNNQTPPPALIFTITDDGQNAGVAMNTAITGGEWRMSSQVTPTAGSGTTPANFSFIFGYTDSQNFYYANFSAARYKGLSGVYHVIDGVAYKVMVHTRYVPTGQATTLELRYKDGDARLYVNGTYLTKAEGVSGIGRVGVAAINSNATFANPTLVTGSSQALALTPVAVVSTAFNPYQCLPVPSNPTRIVSIGRQVAVTNSAELRAAILDAQPGDTITMADGTYSDSMLVGNYTGSFAARADGLADNPITLTGSAQAIIDGNGTSGRYGLYLNGADYWNLVGFTVANAAKGIVLDGSNHAFLEAMKVTNIGQEAIHFRAFSSDNVVKNSVINGTGKESPQFGEGVYIGSASGANWGVHSGGLPDASDRNLVINNTFTDFAGEAIDIKEGSSTNYIAGNYFEGSAIAGQNSADSWVDVKGNCNLLENNSGDNTLLDAYQVHNVYPGWGKNNMFRTNSANVNATGYGFAIDFNALSLDNAIMCNNVVTNAGSGPWNVPCYEPYEI
jgi:hypothetical protein